MNIKVKKAITKGLYIFPFTFFMIQIFGGLLFFRSEAYLLNLFLAFTITCVYLFNQIVEYEKFDDLNRDEFLEARHELLIAYSDEKWNRLIGLLEKPLTKLIALNIEEDVISIKVKYRYLDAYIMAVKTGDHIQLKVKSSSLSFLPNKVRNYKLLKEVIYAIEGGLKALPKDKK